MARPVFYRVIESGVQAINANESRQMVNDITRAGMVTAKMYAPMRSGTLYRSIKRNLAKPNGYLQQEGGFYSNARHSRWVIEGTQGPIRARGGGYMKVPRNRGAVRGALLASSKTRPKESVRGQDANDFFTRALNMALASDSRTTVIARAL